jgi:hypothetical protein
MALPENLNDDKKGLNSQCAALPDDEQSPMLANLRDEGEKTEIIEPAVQEKNVRLTTFILVAAIAAVLIAIWLIHKKAAPAKTAAAITDNQQTAVETAITQLTGIKTDDVEQVDQLVKKFYEFADFKQVDRQQFKRNPFNPSPIASDMTDSSALKKDDDSVKSNAQKMQLQSISQSKYGNCCMIDDALLYKGDKINGFEIVEIGADFVRLRTGGQDITLYLQTE